MANEQQVTASLTVSKGGASDGLFAAFTSTLAGTRFFHNIQSVAFAADEALILGEVAAGGLCLMKNLDASNPVAVKAATGVTPLITIPAGRCALFQLHASATAPFVQATTAAVLIEYILCEA